MALIAAHTLHVPPRLHDINLALAPGQLLGLIGPNGAGKSTLLNALAGLLPGTGEVLLEDAPLATLPAARRAQTIGLLPQNGHSAWALRVADVVALGRLPWQNHDATAIDHAVALTGIAPLLARRVDQLSGGERARVWLARVLAGTPRLLLADEPIASLDLYYQRQVMDVLRDFARGPRGAIVALHDLALAARYCDTLCLLQRGRLVAFGSPREVLTPTHLQHVFGLPVHVDLDHQPPVITPL